MLEDISYRFKEYVMNLPNASNKILKLIYRMIIANYYLSNREDRHRFIELTTPVGIERWINQVIELPCDDENNLSIDILMARYFYDKEEYFIDIKNYIIENNISFIETQLEDIEELNTLTSEDRLIIENIKELLPLLYKNTDIRKNIANNLKYLDNKNLATYQYEDIKHYLALESEDDNPIGLEFIDYYLINCYYLFNDEECLFPLYHEIIANKENKEYLENFI